MKNLIIKLIFNKYIFMALNIGFILTLFLIFKTNTVYAAEIIEAKPINEMTNQELEEHMEKLNLASLFIMIGIPLIIVICIYIEGGTP